MATTRRALIVVSALAIAALARTVGPLFFVPTAVGLSLMAFGLTPVPWRRVLPVLSLAAFAVPVALEWLGVLPSSYAYVDGGLLVRAQMVALPPHRGELFIAGNTLALLVNAALFVGRARADQSAAEERLVLQAWHLRPCIAAGEAEVAAPGRCLRNRRARDYPAVWSPAAMPLIVMKRTSRMRSRAAGSSAARRRASSSIWAWLKTST